jgi:hypothetical protein
MDKPLTVTQAVLMRIVFVVVGLVLVWMAQGDEAPIYYLVAAGFLVVSAIPTRVLAGAVKPGGR